MLVFLDRGRRPQVPTRETRASTPVISCRYTPVDADPCFRDYAGPPNDYHAGVAYFLKKFLRQNGMPDRKIYNHVTCATDTENVKVVMESTRNIIVSNLVNAAF